MTLTRIPLLSLLLACALPLGGACGDGGSSAQPDSDVAADSGDAADGAGDAGPDADASVSGEATLNGWRVAIDPDACSWSLTPPDATAPVLRGPEGCETWLQVAGSGQPVVESLFGAFQIDLQGVGWQSPAPGTTPTLTRGEGFIEARFPVGQGTAALRFQAYGDEGLRVALVADGNVRGGRVSWQQPEGTSVFGLGTQTASMDLAGRRFPLWTQEQGIGKPDGGGLFPIQNIPEAAYAPMGVWHTTAGWSAVLDIDAYAELDLRGPTASLRSFGEPPALVLLGAPTPAARMTQVTEIIGRIDAPAPWTFAPWNDAVGGPDRLREVATLLRAEGIPSSAIWSEDWIGGEEGPTGFRLSYAWAWDPELYPDLPEDIAWLHARGFAFLAYFNPFVPQPTPMWQEGVDGGWLVDSASGEPYVIVDPAGRNAGLVDLTDPAATAWLQGYLDTAARTLRVDGWMADFAEWLPQDAVLHSGEDPWVVHNRYPLLWQAANRATMEEVHGGGPSTGEGWTFFARSGWASTRGASAALAPVMWGGDQDTDWDRDDGLASVIPIITHVGLSGVPLFGTDVAGYSSFLAAPTDKELFYRWSAMAAFHPVMRTHHGSSECANWSFDRDADTLDHYRRWTTVHTLLLPLWTRLAQVAADTGLPPIRHPWLVDPDHPSLWAGTPDMFFVGDDLLVAPVITQGATSRDVRLPGTGWWPLLDTTPLTDPAQADGTVLLSAQAAPTEVPAFVRPGTIVPLLAEAVVSFYGATEPGVTDLGDLTGLRLALYPDSDGALRATTASTQAGTLTVSGEGFLPPIDWTQATVDGQPLSPCASGAAVPPCTLPGGVWLAGPQATLRVGPATLTLTGDDSQARYLVALAGVAWGNLAQPTPIGDLHAQVPPPCEAAP